MGFRFRKRIRILPGIYLNLSKSGISTTIGGRGASINIGKTGAYLNTSIPGTGISRRDRLWGGKQGGGQAGSAPPAQPSAEEIASEEVVTSPGLKGLQEEILRAILDRKEIQEEIQEHTRELAALQEKATRAENSFFGKLFSNRQEVEGLKEKIKENEEYLTELNDQLEASPAKVNTLMEEGILNTYQQVVERFEAMCTSEKIWDVTAQVKRQAGDKSSAATSVNKEVVRFSTTGFDHIQSDFPALHFENANGSQLYLYPGFVLFRNEGGEIQVIDIREIKWKFRASRFIVQPGQQPADAAIIDSTWERVNKDGSPDRRFSNNRELMVVKYGEFEISSAGGLQEVFMISDYNKCFDFSCSVRAYLSELSIPENHTDLASMSSPRLNKDAFDAIIATGRKNAEFIRKLSKDEVFLRHLQEKFSIQGMEDADAQEKLDLIFTYDLMRCFLLFREMDDLRSREAFAFLYMLMAKESDVHIGYEEHERLYRDQLITSYLGIYQTIKGDLHQDVPDEERFKLTTVLRGYDENMAEEYMAGLYRFASVVVKADGKVTADEENALKRIIVKGKATIHTEKSTAAPASDTKETPEKIMEELHAMTGLQAVKEQINTLINFIRIQQAREKSGLRAQSVSYHVVFTGNPGTGKTTVARMLARIYQSLGVLEKGQLIETDRSGLVAEYVGQTAVKTNKIVDSALDGILFIDEAYAVVADAQDSYGKEAVATLIKRMEDDRARLIVILAGYAGEMKAFIDTNPGFKSRFNRYIEFTDYNPAELLQIFEGLCRKSDYTLTESARQGLQIIVEQAYASRDKSFGNGRYVRNLFERTMERQANRLASVSALTPEVLSTILPEDLDG